MSRRKNYHREETEAKPVEKKVGFKPKTKGQYSYLKKIMDNTVTFCVGPSGTGKSYIALAAACQAYLNNEILNIIIARPAVEASETGLGYLKGELKDKLGPYVAPAIANMQKLLGRDVYNDAVNNQYIQFHAMEYLRGSTFDNAYMILEEAQNCTLEQLIMFVTRIGEGSKIVISGDSFQSDLQLYGKTDLEKMISKIKNSGLANVGCQELTHSDIVRHPIIGDFLTIFGG